MFSTTDPLGREIRLESRTWNKHIITSHPEMYKQEALVKKVIENPKYILKDKTKPDTRDNYFELCNHPSDGSLSIMKVVVDFSTGTGDVTTSYPIKSTTTQATTFNGRGVKYERP
ncbi:hypothetical protein [Desulfotomaculum defluvii]